MGPSVWDFSQRPASNAPGKGALPFQPSRSTTVAGTSRRLTASWTTSPAGIFPGKAISSGTWTSGS